MNYRILRNIPSPEELQKQLPLSAALGAQISKQRKIIKAILRGEDPRQLIILGPCSAWPEAAVLEYADHIAALQTKLQEKLLLVMRVYIQKPRTQKGWIGPANQPDLFAPPNISEGMYQARRMMLQVIKKGVAIADEALFLQNAPGFLDLLSWMAIGARSSENQAHRLFASSIDLPTGFKNPTHGNLTIGVNSIIAAQSPHVTTIGHQEIQTFGNPYAHLLLRGGNDQPNYDLNSIRQVYQLFEKNQLKNPALLIDLSHENAIIDGVKDYRRQPIVLLEVLQNLATDPQLRSFVKGFMIESFLKPGTQKELIEERDQLDLSTLASSKCALDLGGLSITDPCLGWEETEAMLLELR